jgi:hypothetical protein
VFSATASIAKNSSGAISIRPLFSLLRCLLRGIEGSRLSYKGRRQILDASKGIYLGGTLLSILISLYLFTSGRRETGIFVGLWAPTVLNLGQTLLEDDD